MQVKFLTPARSDVREIIGYYNDQRDGLGSEFVIYQVRDDVILIAAIQHHQQQPDSWRNRIKEP